MPQGDGWLVSCRKEVNICPSGRRCTDQLSTGKDPLMIKAQGDLRSKAILVNSVATRCLYAHK